MDTPLPPLVIKIKNRLASSLLLDGSHWSLAGMRPGSVVPGIEVHWVQVPGCWGVSAPRHSGVGVRWHSGTLAFGCTGEDGKTSYVGGADLYHLSWGMPSLAGPMA